MPFFVKRNGQAVPIVSDPNVINDTTASQNTAFSGSKVDSLIANHTHASNQINAMTGYSKPSSTSNITPADSLNTAIGKVEKGLEGKQSPLSLGQYSGLGREIQIMDNEEVGQTWYNTGVVDIEPSSSEGKLTISKVDDSTFPGSAPYTSEDIDIPGWEKVENSPITVSATGTDLALSTSSGSLNALTVYGKSEVVDGTIKSAGEGWSTVDLGTLEWGNASEGYNCFYNNLPNTNGYHKATLMAKYTQVDTVQQLTTIDKTYCRTTGAFIVIHDTDYTDATAFKNSLNGVILAYELADPTQGNTIAVKTDDGTGINGTMATFTTGTPLRGTDENIRDVAEWDGSAGEVTKKCSEVDLGTLTWSSYLTERNTFVAPVSGIKNPETMNERITGLLCENYALSTGTAINWMNDKSILRYAGSIYIRDTSYSDPTAFKTSLSGVMLIYELATPTTQTLTPTENASIAGLRTFEPQTHAQNNAGATMTVEAYAGTQNGKAITEIADKLDTLTPKVYSLFIAKTDWDETGTVEIDVPGTFGYDIPSENYNQLVLSDEQTNYWRKFNVRLDHAHDASGYITTIEFSCDYDNIPDRVIFFNIVSSRPKYVDWSGIDNLIVPPGLQVDTKLDSDSTNPVQNKVIKSALDGKATPADIAALIDDTAAAQDKAYSSAKVEEKVEGEEITTKAAGSDLTLSTSSGNINALTVFGKSEVVDGSIKSAGEGWATVRLADLTWSYNSGTSLPFFYTTLPNYSFPTTSTDEKAPLMCNKYDTTTQTDRRNKGISGYSSSTSSILISDTDYTTVSDFVASLGDAILCYQLADPTQGNTIAVKTDNGTGIDGTMATFTTGTPLRATEDGTVRDVMQWNGTSGYVTNKLNTLDVSSTSWGSFAIVNNVFYRNVDGCKPNSQCLSNKYTHIPPCSSAYFSANAPDKSIAISDTVNQIFIRDDDYTDPQDFRNANVGTIVQYELATPIITPLTTAENDNIASLRTYTPQTHAQNNAGADMTVEAYAGTANGQAVSELKQDVQSEISALKITQSATLTLTTAGWSSNQQTVTYAHDTAKRNVIDVDPASVEEWASCGVLATTETASGITFTCKTVPENALTFRVTSMGV